MRILLLLTIVSLVSCVSSSRRDPKPVGRPEVDSLTLELAQARKAQIQKVDYDLFVHLEKKASTYRYRVTAHTVLNDVQKPLSLDYLGKTIVRIVVNGTLVEDFRVRTGSIEIPAKYLKPQTQIEIEGVNDYNKNGVGFQRTLDLQDDREYLFTDFEPYEAHQFFPCFDQPDLKAKFRVTLDAPTEWTAISNTPVAQSKKQGDRSVTTFQETKPISTYLVFVGAGPFAVWEDKVDGIPLRFFARQSLAKYVDHKRLFDTTKKGMKFFNDYFGYPYPFLKYDQIFVPEFASGGMENVGAVILNERGIPRGQLAPAMLLSRDSLILHEMAHMWFGDLVTMNWWNDLWLNEAFATYAASLALDRALGNRDASINLLLSKASGYHEDSSVTTHPIETPVSDTSTAMANFDQITYGKGASVLKQLHFTVGEKAFRDGLRAYFTEHAFQNTSRQDFISAIANAWGKSLDPWTAAWLQSAGPNRVKADWECKGGKIARFEILQKPNQTGSLAQHKTRVGLYRKASSELKMFKSLEVSYEVEKSSISAFVGAACPDFVHLNVDDFDYAFVEVDPISLRQVKFGLAGGLRNPLDRASLWQIVNEMVFEQRLSVIDYFDMVAAALKVETNPLVILYLSNRSGLLAQYYFQYLTRPQRDHVAAALEKSLEGRLNELQFFDMYKRFAHTPRALEKLRQFLRGKDLPKGIQLDQDRRWEIIITLAREGATGVEGLIADERKRDGTTSGAKFELTARTAIPSREAKREFWQKITKGAGNPFQDLRFAADEFSVPGHPEYFEPLADEYFHYLESVEWTNSSTLVGPIIKAMFPINACTPEMLKRSEASLKAARSLSSYAKRTWMKSNEDLEHCIRIRAKAVSR